MDDCPQLPPLTLPGWLASIGIGGWFASEAPAGFDRNQRLVCVGTRTLVHEVIVVRPPANGAALPYDGAKGEVIEKRVKDLGEVSDLPPSQSGSLTVQLSPGTYLLICNQPNHYKAGMWTKLTVTR